MLYTLVMICIAGAALVGISGLLHTLANPRYQSCLNYAEPWRYKRQRARERRAWKKQQDQVMFASMNRALKAKRERLSARRPS